MARAGAICRRRAEPTAVEARFSVQGLLADPTGDEKCRYLTIPRREDRSDARPHGVYGFKIELDGFDDPDFLGAFYSDGPDPARDFCSTATGVVNVVPTVLEVSVDFKPGSCPNPVNVESKGLAGSWAVDSPDTGSD